MLLSDKIYRINMIAEKQNSYPSPLMASSALGVERLGEGDMSDLHSLDTCHLLLPPSSEEIK